MRILVDMHEIGSDIPIKLLCLLGNELLNIRIAKRGLHLTTLIWSGADVKTRAEFVVPTISDQADTMPPGNPAPRSPGWIGGRARKIMPARPPSD